ncbi:LysE family translocator [Roseivivax sp. CAU 1761]
MTPETLTALTAFAFVTVATPGPNNFMLMASGANFGLRRSLGHMAGVALGFPAMMAAVGLGVTRLFDLWPPAYAVLTGLSLLYMLWLAWKIATAAPPAEAETAGAARPRPLRFAEAAAFQWVNPKAWSMALAAVALYAPGREAKAVAWIAGIYVACSLFSTSGWTMLGTGLARLLADRRRLRLFNRAMAALLVLSLLPVLLS